MAAQIVIKINLERLALSGASLAEALATITLPIVTPSVVWTADGWNVGTITREVTS